MDAIKRQGSTDTGVPLVIDNAGAVAGIAAGDIAGADAAGPGVEPCRNTRNAATRTRLHIKEMARKPGLFMSPQMSCCFE